MLQVVNVASSSLKFYLHTIKLIARAAAIFYWKSLPWKWDAIDISVECGYECVWGWD